MPRPFSQTCYISLYLPHKCTHFICIDISLSHMLTISLGVLGCLTHMLSLYLSLHFPINTPSALEHPIPTPASVRHPIHRHRPPPHPSPPSSTMPECLPRPRRPLLEMDVSHPRRQTKSIADNGRASLRAGFPYRGKISKEDNLV